MPSLRNIRSSLTSRRVIFRSVPTTWLLLAGAALILVACSTTSTTQATFPWPPPTPSTSMVLPDDLFFKNPSSFGKAALKLETALNATGYWERRYFVLEDGGFVILTRLEQTDSAGTPKAVPDRWSTGIASDSFSPIDFIRRYVTAPNGYYQVIAFVITDKPFGFQPPPKDSSPVNNLFSQGYNALPGSVASRETSSKTKCTVLIYAFSKQPGLGDSTAATWMSNGVSAQDRLMKDNLWPSLQKAALEMAHDG